MTESLSTCPICHNAPPFRSTGVAIGPGLVQRCLVCHGVFLNPPGKVKYDDSGWTQIRRQKWVQDVERARQYAPRIISVASTILGRPVRRVLEVGCGSAYMGIGFRGEGVDYTGLEVDHASIRWARERALDVEYVAAETLDTWLAERVPYDLLLSSNTYEHVQDPEQAFKALGRAPLGLIAIIVPNPDGLVAALKANRTLREVASLLSGNRQTAWSLDGTWHNIAYTSSTLRFLGEQNEIDVIDIRSIAVNDPVWGFVQPNQGALYKMVEKLEDFTNQRTMLLMLARPKLTSVRSIR